MPVSGRLADMTAEGSSLRKSVSRRLSAHRRSLLGLSCSHRGIHLPCGRPTRRASRRDSDGVSVFRVVEIRPGWVLPLRRDGGVRTAGTASPTVTCRFSTANPVLRSRIPSPEGADNGAYGNSLHVHPSGLPQPVAPGWHRSPWALPRASHHPVTQVACRGGESVWTLARSQRRTPPSIPHPLRSLTSRDLTSHGCAQLPPDCCDSPARRSCTSLDFQRLTAHCDLVSHDRHRHHPGIITALLARASNDPSHSTKVWPPDSPATSADTSPAPLQGSLHIPMGLSVIK
jgi:hypothetical protein